MKQGLQSSMLDTQHITPRTLAKAVVGKRGMCSRSLGSCQTASKPGVENCFSKTLEASVSRLCQCPVLSKALALPYRRKLCFQDTLEEEQPS